MADLNPYRNTHTRVVQLITDEQAAVFPGQFEKLAEDYAEREAAAAQAQADLDAVTASDASKSEIKDATQAAKDAQAALDAAVVAPTEPSKEA